MVQVPGDGRGDWSTVGEASGDGDPTVGEASGDGGPTVTDTTGKEPLPGAVMLTETVPGGGGGGLDCGDTCNRQNAWSAFSTTAKKCSTASQPAP